MPFDIPFEKPLDAEQQQADEEINRTRPKNIGLCRIFDVIKQLSTLQECDMTDYLPEKDFVTRGFAQISNILAMFIKSDTQTTATVYFKGGKSCQK